MTSTPQFEILAYEPTPLGVLCLRRRELLSRPGTIVTEVTLDHEFLMSSLNTLSERELANGGLEMHPGQDLRVLIGGLGLGYTAFEVLKSARVAYVEVVEFLPQVVSWLDEELFPLAPELKADSRLTVVQDDVYARLASDPGPPFDLILIDVDHSPDEKLGDTSSFFYSKEGLEKARQHLALDGVLGVWSAASSSPFVTALKAVFSAVSDKEVSFTNTLIDELSTDHLFFARP